MSKQPIKSIFSFCVCEKGAENTAPQGFEVLRNIGGYVFYADSRTPIDYFSLNGRELIIYGYAVNVIDGQCDSLSEKALKTTGNLDGIIEFEKNLGGKYAIFYSENGSLYCIGDATCSLPVYYCRGTENFICCSNPQLIIGKFNLKKDKTLLKIRNSGNLNQAMPFDVTEYKEIKQLIPNHYLDFSKKSAVRFINSKEKQKIISPQSAAEITAPMIEKITAMYLSKFKIYCPLTSGRDSRVVLAFLKSMYPEKIRTYTVWQDNFEKDDQDWTVPVLLTDIDGDIHSRLYSDEITKEQRSFADGIFGEKAYPDDAYRLALTLNKHYSDGAIAEGDIIGQVGKCSLHRDIPLVFANAGYFRCKLHNYSREARLLIKEWMKEIKRSKEKTNIYDLFSVESRLGRWSAQTHIIHNTMGQVYINIFNSRSIIYTWTAVDRAKRIKAEIHIALINQRYPKLLEIPFEKEKSGIMNLAKSNAIIFYLASYLKFIIQGIQFRLKKS